MRWFRSISLLALCCAVLAATGALAEDYFHRSVTVVDAETSEEEFDEESDDGIIALSFEEDLESEEPPPDPDAEPSLADEIRSMRDRLHELEIAEEKRTATEKKKKEADAKKPPGKDDKPKEDVWFDVSEEKWTVRLGGHVQMDLVNWAIADPAITGPLAAPPARDYFEFRRLRLVADGQGYGVYDFRLQLTLEPETTNDATGATFTEPQVKDAYFSINEVPWFGRLRIGNFFVPFGLEQVTNDTMNIFLERSNPTQGVFTADREVGLAAYNVSADQNFTWSYGIFIDSISESLKQRVDNNQGYRLSSRITWLPYYDEQTNGRYLIHTGLGALHTDDHDGVVRFAARPELRLAPRLVDTGNLQAPSTTIGNVELAIVCGRVTMQSEAYLAQVNLANNNEAILHGAYVHLSWFLTGENRVYERFGQHGAQFARNAPYTNVFFTPGGFGLGAWEAKARWSYLSLDDINKGRLDDMTLGMNWYWSDRTRIMFDYVHPITSRTSTFGATNSDIIGMRFDFNW